jgi:hypothetical protein
LSSTDNGTCCPYGSYDTYIFSIEINVLPSPDLENIILILGVMGCEIDFLEASCSVYSTLYVIMS